MAASAFNRCIPAFLIHALVAILTELMRSFLKAVDFCISNIQGVAAGTFGNHHDLSLGMMTNGAGICCLVVTMWELSRFACLFGLQDNNCRAKTYLHSECTTYKEE